MSVEGIPQRDQIVTFTAHFASYHPGEVAAFTVEEAQELADRGVANAGGGEGPPPTAPPVNVTAPYVEQVGAVLNCTMGTWSGEPTAYAYQWQLDGADIGTNAPSYAVQPTDIGHAATCVVTATNDLGSTEGPPSNGVVVT